MKLVLHNNGPTDSSGASNPSQGYVSVHSSGGMSFYNVNVFKSEQEKLIEKKRLKKAEVSEQKRIMKIKKNIASDRAATRNCDRIKINGDQYVVAKNGKLLLPIRMFQITNPKKCTLNGIKYTRTKLGAFRVLSKQNEVRFPKEDCFYFTRTMCEKGSNCQYEHNKEKIRICPMFLAGRCFNRNCLLSHTPNDHNTPLCRYFLDRSCTNPACRYRHHKPAHYDDQDYEIWTCRPFAVGGYCERGKKCPFLHLLNCPDFEEDNYCPDGRDCKLNHQFTLRNQDMISTKSNKYVRDPTVVTEEPPLEPLKKVINSYTVDPATLWMRDTTGNYQFYIDNEGSQFGDSKDSNQFVIELSDSEEEEEEESDFSSEEEDDDDELEHNDDYVGV
ncbi:hypothetical protein G210_0756 [Candida maltosa Xu316]|uniref:C3H1-type domain-containing protein n=1 Tax=Candida maltosa (strain Xu316) TaxID=1245528 RepID=M3K046_CANMX|nr:hypothetical protein G210_0756 [Candida maltosa Xu316]